MLEPFETLDGDQECWTQKEDLEKGIPDAQGRQLVLMRYQELLQISKINNKKKMENDNESEEEIQMAL